MSLNVGSLFRALDEKEYLCIGISKEGYNKISDVIKEIEKESSVSNIKIDCNSKNLNIIILFVIFYINLTIFYNLKY